VSKVAEKILPLVEPLAESLGLELVDVEFVKDGGGYILRILVDRDGGVTHKDCEALSSVLGDELDKVDPIEESYSMEVSSPGIERPLKKAGDFIRFAGSRVRVNLFSSLDGKKSIIGTLRGMEENLILVEDENNNFLKIPMAQVAKANLSYFD
jgi:ribosome maturation factor RimP